MLTFLAAFLFIFNEWLFAVTKPSFLNSLDIIKQLDILLVTSVLLAFLCFFGLLPLVIAGFLPPLKAHLDKLIKLGGLLPAFIFAILILMMVDNFTYTVFKWGIVSSHGWSRGLYGLGFVMLVFLCYRRTLSSLSHISRRSRIWGISPNRILALVIGFLLLPVGIIVFLARPQVSSLTIAETNEGRHFPDILLITSDGLSASHMSMYGYTRDTTPHIRQLADSALVAENAFPNSGKTTGSVISLYTGKYPTETQVLFPPDILTGDDAYQHLPGILKSQGYRTIQIATPYYLDATTLNLLNGFDEVKTRSGVFYSKYIGAISRILPHDKALFTDEIVKRVDDRVRHIFFLQEMVNPYLQVTGMAEPLLDIERFEILKHEMRTSQQPVFIHIHLLVTHGPKYKVTEQKYSVGQSINAQSLWTDDFYDDSILEFDKNTGELIDYLAELDLLDDTILIIGSDHGQRWDPVKRIPLIIRFPNGEYAGKIQANVQNLDIAPTILDYINIAQPAWMQGKSLIDGGLEQRLIYSLTAIDPEDLNPAGNMSEEMIQQLPSDKLYISTLIYCDKWFKLDALFLEWESGVVEGSTVNCPSENEITDEQAFQLIFEQLNANGFDVSAFDTLFP